MAMDQWSWVEEDALLYNGITIAAGGILTGFCFATIGPLSKKIDERLLLIFAGIIPMILGRIVMMPFGDEHPEFIGDPNECDNYVPPEEGEWKK